MQPCRVYEEGLRVVKYFQRGGRGSKVNTFAHCCRRAPANSVPAAAVIRRVQALIGITGRKAHAGGLLVRCEIPGLNLGTASDTGKLESRQGGRIPGVAVKCVRSGGIPVAKQPPGRRLTLGAKAWGANRCDYPGSPRRKRCRLGGCALEAWLPELTR